MIKKFCTACILVGMAFCGFAFVGIEAKVIESRHIEEVLPLIDDETWFLVDLDNCLFEGAQALGHANWFYEEVQERLERGMSRDEALADFYPNWIKTQKICRVKPLEEGFVPGLLKLQHEGVVIMGLTHRQPSIVDATLQQVSSLGFDFSKTAPYPKGCEVAAQSPAWYASGILFVSDYNRKIDVFKQFLIQIGRKPRKVLFIDDKKKNVEELESLSHDGIEYIGVHYTAIEYVNPLYKREIAEFQSKFLDQIMSNEAALILMEKDLN